MARLIDSSADPTFNGGFGRARPRPGSRTDAIGFSRAETWTDPDAGDTWDGIDPVFAGTIEALTEGVDADAAGMVPADARRGRGSLSNRSGRYESALRAPVHDGWSAPTPVQTRKTEVQVEAARRIITRNTSPDLSFDRSINAYRGCEHGCSYCFARPTHAYVGLSPGLDFETKLFVKPNAARLLEQELAEPGYQPRVIALGTNTDPYQPIEKTHRLTRSILEVLEAAGHPVAIVTKSHLVTRDLDILARMASRGLAKVALSVTTLDPALARAMEPRAATPERRLDAIAQLSAAGVPAAVLVSPIIPALTDPEIERILDAAQAHGARDAGYILLRLPLEVAELFKEWLLAHAPDRYRHVLSVLRTMRGGADYDATWGRRMKGGGPYAWTISRRFDLALKRLGMGKAGRTKLRTDLFVPPVMPGTQLSLF